jgi:hypothetical protein
MAEYDDVIWLHGRHEVSIVELAQCAAATEAEVRELVEYGALSPSGGEAMQWTFSAGCVARVRVAMRLRRDLELGTPEAALALSFLERIEELESRVRELNAQLQAPQRR